MSNHRLVSQGCFGSYSLGLGNLAIKREYISLNGTVIIAERGLLGSNSTTAVNSVPGLAVSGYDITSMIRSIACRGFNVEGAPSKSLNAGVSGQLPSSDILEVTYRGLNKTGLKSTILNYMVAPA